MSKYFRTRRESDRIIVLDEISQELTYGLNKTNYINIEDNSIIESILNIQKEGDISYIDLADNIIKADSYTYRGIPGSDVNRVSILKAARGKLLVVANDVDMVDYISYIEANNTLSSQGFFITDKNREEKYLEILETGDDSLIDALEEFLNVKDSLSILKSAKKTYDDIQDKVLGTAEDDTERLEKIREIV